ncbi:DNA/RNA non-specific endonuclease [Crossiella sp. CA198]|uniref:DNA/RNA non-specific endonuclease n=1 Tax=Crossiella sp. CA198 TaxID=3455607 RepID=UPI003F8D7AD9
MRPGLKRPTGAVAVLCPGPLNEETREGRDFAPPGWPDDNPRRMKGYAFHRGHLLAHMFGGTEQNENIVTLHAAANLAPNGMGLYEKMTARALGSGEEVYYQVVPVYENSGLRPKYVDMYAIGSGGFCIDVRIENSRTAGAVNRGRC